MDATQSVAYDFDYCIVGSGPAGLAAATMLARQGSRVAVFESRPRPDNVFGSYPVVLNARGLASLETLGQTVMDKIKSIGIDVSELHVVPNNRTVARVKTFGTGIMRDQVAQVLLEEAEAEETVTLFWEHKFSCIDFATRRCTFTLPDLSEVSFSAARVVAADGNRSKIRTACEKEVEGFSASADPWGFQLRFMTSKGTPGQTEVDSSVHFVLGDKGYICQQPDGVWSISLRVLPDSDEDFLTAEEATEERVQQLRKYVQTYAKFADEHLLDDEAYQRYYSCRAFDGVVVKCSSLSPLDWLCFIGDAAHAVQPATGEGINSGLEDAAVLARAVKEHPENPLAAYDAAHRRNSHALNVLALQAKELVVGTTPRKNAANVMTTIGLGIGKKLRIVEGTKQDFMLGEKARTVGVRSYADLVEMERRQTKWLRPTATAIAALFGAKDTLPDTAKAAHSTANKIADENTTDAPVAVGGA
jgi:kynurenine 3-monooxygenase